MSFGIGDLNQLMSLVGNDSADELMHAGAQAIITRSTQNLSDALESMAPEYVEMYIPKHRNYWRDQRQKARLAQERAEFEHQQKLREIEIEKAQAELDLIKAQSAALAARARRNPQQRKPKPKP